MKNFAINSRSDLDLNGKVQSEFIDACFLGWD